MPSIVGAGPNGLAAAITLARAGRSVLVLEGAETVGGGLRSAELTLPGFLHDPCSAFHPLGIASPLWRGLPLAEHGLAWIQPPRRWPTRSTTARRWWWSGMWPRRRASSAGMRPPTGASWGRSPAIGSDIIHEFLGPLRFPRHPFSLVRFGLAALWPATTLARLAFRGERARAVFAGMSAHSIMPLEWPATAAFGFMLGILAHAVGWPIVPGGSQRFADALASYFRSLGGEIVTGRTVRSLADLPPAAATLFDVTPRQLIAIAGDRLPAGYQRRLGRYRHGPGVCKVDFALDGPIPWRAAECLRAGTVHVGGTLEEIAAAERAAWQGEHPERPFLILGQQSLFDPTRAPAGKHTVWAYCHVPNGSTVDMTDRIAAQIERFAPGFRARILAAHTRTAAEMAAYNPNYIGGDINGGVQDLRQLFTRPVASLNPYATPARASTSAPPPPRPAAACMACAAISPPRPR